MKGILRKLEVLTLASIALALLGVASASPALATSGSLETFPAGSKVLVSAEQFGTHEFRFTDLSVEFPTASCEKAIFAPVGISEEEDTTVRLHPEFGNCKAFGSPATVTATNCDYLLHIGTPTAGGMHVTKDVVCSAGSAIKIATAACEVTIGSQTGLFTSGVTNIGGSGTAMDLLVSTAITGLVYTVTKDGIGCPLSGTGSYSKGDYSGKTTVKARDYITEEAAGITVEGAPHAELIATGEQVGENALQLTEHLIGGQPASVKCKSMKFTGTEAVKGFEGELRVHPVYSECTAFGAAATVTTTNCDYLLVTGALTEGGRNVTTDIVCSGGSVIKVTTSSCEVTIEAQNGLTTSEVTNAGSEEAMDMLLHTSIGGIHYTVVKDNTGCPLGGTGSFSQGDYTGTTTIKAHDSLTGSAAGITIDTALVATGEQVGENSLQLTDHPISGGGVAELRCKSMKFTGTEPLPEGLEELRVHPEDKECTAFGQPATVYTHDCDYLLDIGTPTTGGWHVTTDVVCLEGLTIRIATGTCEVAIAPQSGLSTSELTNAGSEEDMDLLLHTNITGIKYTVVKDNIGCPLSGKGEFSKGDYTGTTTVRAHDSLTKKVVGLTKS